VGAIVGLTPTPYDSGKAHREQGISKVLLVLQRLDLGIGQLPAGKLTQQPLPNPGAISAVID
jgi:transposase